MDDGLTVELLAEEPSPSRPAASRGPAGGWSRWSRRQRIAAGAGAAALLAAAVAVVPRLLPDQPWPTVQVITVADIEPPAGAPGLWQPGADGRPAAELTVSLAPRVERVVPKGAPAYAGDSDLEVQGLAGPGVVRNELPPTRVPPEDRSVEVPLRARIDCTRVPAVVPEGAYGLQVQAAYSGDRRHQVVTDSDHGRSWARAIQNACSSWDARRSLTITRLTARATARPDTLGLSLTVTNSGERPAGLDVHDVGERPSASGAGQPVISGALPVRVPPRSSVTADITVTVRGCDVAAPPTPGTVDVTSRLGLVAYTGPVPEEAPARGGDNDGVSGVVLSDAASAELSRGLLATCAGLTPPVVRVPGNGVRREEEHGDILVDLDITVPAGKVRSVDLQPDATYFTVLAPDGKPLQPSDWQNLTEMVRLVPVPTPGPQTLAPDASGRLHATILIISNLARHCEHAGIGLPAVELTVHPFAAGQRPLHYRLDLQTSYASFARVLCLPRS